jgi:hypothetical protein
MKKTSIFTSVIATCSLLASISAFASAYVMVTCPTAAVVNGVANTVDQNSIVRDLSRHWWYDNMAYSNPTMDKYIVVDRTNDPTNTVNVNVVSEISSVNGQITILNTPDNEQPNVTAATMVPEFTSILGYFEGDMTQLTLSDNIHFSCSYTLNPIPSDSLTAGGGFVTWYYILQYDSSKVMCFAQGVSNGPIKCQPK